MVSRHQELRLTLKSAQERGTGGLPRSSETVPFRDWSRFPTNAWVGTMELPRDVVMRRKKFYRLIKFLNVAH